MGEGELCERGFLGPLLWEQTLRWMFVCRWLTKDAVRINSCGGVKEAGLGRGDAEATRRHNKWLQQTSRGALELGWPLRVVPNWGKWANPYDPRLPVNEHGLPTAKMLVSTNSFLFSLSGPVYGQTCFIPCSHAVSIQGWAYSAIFSWLKLWLGRWGNTHSPMQWHGEVDSGYCMVTFSHTSLSRSHLHLWFTLALLSLFPGHAWICRSLSVNSKWKTSSPTLALGLSSCFSIYQKVPHWS